MQARCIEGKKLSGYNQTVSRGNIFKLVKSQIEKKVSEIHEKLKN